MLVLYIFTPLIMVSDSMYTSYIMINDILNGGDGVSVIKIAAYIYKSSRNLIQYSKLKEVKTIFPK